MLNSINTSYEKQKFNSKNKKYQLVQNQSKSKAIKNSEKLNYNIIVAKTTPNNKNISLNNNLINNININGNFISYSNKISNLIKNHYNRNILYISNIKLLSESINEQTLFSRSAINDILVYLNQLVKPGYNSSMSNINEQYIKDKLFKINLKMKKINNFKNNLILNIKNNEASLNLLYKGIKKLLSKI